MFRAQRRLVKSSRAGFDFLICCFLTAEAMRAGVSSSRPKNPAKRAETWDAGTSVLPPEQAHEGGKQAYPDTVGAWLTDFALPLRSPTHPKKQGTAHPNHKTPSPTEKQRERSESESNPMGPGWAFAYKILRHNNSNTLHWCKHTASIYC